MTLHKQMNCTFYKNTYIQEAQLSLTNRATRVKDTKHGTIPYVRYGFLLVCYSNFVRKIFDFKNAVTLKTGLRVRKGY